MTTPTKAPAQPAPKLECETRKFTVEEYYRMAEVGILHPDERVELLEGAIISMPPIGPLHNSGVDRSNFQFGQSNAGRYIVRAQGAIRLNDNSEPEPDVALLRFQEDFYATNQPTPENILLVIEVSDSSLTYDRDVKVNLYAQAIIPETWIMNLVDDCIEAFTGPGPEGYANHAVYRRGDRIAPSTLPDVEFAVEDLLPPVPETESQETQTEGEQQA